MELLIQLVKGIPFHPTELPGEDYSSKQNRSGECMEKHGSSSESKERLNQQVWTFWLSSVVFKLSSIKLIKEEGAAYLFVIIQIYLHNHFFFQPHISSCLFCVIYCFGFDLVPCKYIVFGSFRKFYTHILARVGIQMEIGEWTQDE